MNELVSQFRKEIGNDPIYPFRGAFAPLLIILSWNDARLPEEKRSTFPLLMINKGRDSLAAISETAYKATARNTLVDYLEGSVSIASLKEGYEEIYTSLANLYEKTVANDLMSESDENILKILHQATEDLSQLTIRTMFIETLDYEMIHEASGENQKTVSEIWEKATHPYFASFEVRWRKKLFSLLEQYSEDEAALRARYIFTDYYKPKEINYIASELEKVKKKHAESELEAKTTADRLEHEQQSFVEWRKNLPAHDQKLVDYIQYVMEARDIRKDPIAQAQVLIYNRAKELARRAGIEERYILSVIAYEYERGVDWLRANREDIERRSEGCVILIRSDGSFSAECADFEAACEQLLAAEGDLETEKEIKGQSASKGKASGRVRVMLDVSPDAVFEEGEILVTSMTRPEFVPYMKKAAAVITNEGGITCHAAIVSRELGLPCVIGTKFATKILKTGDLVEVDADNGIVTIVNDK